ncbi:hypothetical protein PIB30_084853, partial [Stylosanthes scabra]|nr:hypothetical protein [Stylosanthes scabra]
VDGHRKITWYKDNSDNEDDHEARCEFNNENENVGEDEEANTVGQIAMVLGNNRTLARHRVHTWSDRMQKTQQ